ncbi:MAG TPA: hypothetical protein VFE53_03315 [Mucilaginibacter sp.]|nr:hypothetical protein [Mucilaginibacter sp.]
MDHKKVFAVMGIGALFLISLVISQYYNALNQAELQKKRKTEYGWLHFTGKVSHYRLYKYMNKNFYQVCVKLDSPNLKPVMVYNDDDAIKVNKGIATFSAGYYDRVLGPADSVAVNVDNSGKVIFHYATHAIAKQDFKFEPMGLLRKDLDGCN